jgi:hypothetical protein
MSELLPRPLSYRAELLSRLMPALRAGECCSLIGVSGVGKSNLVRFLYRWDVQESYWNTGNVWIVLIDTHSFMFGEQSLEYVVFELMIHRLIMEIERRGAPAEIASWASDLHAQLVAQPSAHMAFRYLERICARLCESLGLQVVFVFDQFEDLWKRAEPRFFLNLRSLRDQFKYRVVYLVITRNMLQRSQEHVVAAESFWELFTSHVFGLGMYSAADTSVMLERLAARRNIALDPALQTVVMGAGGHHPGLMRALFWELCERPAAERSEQDLLALPTVEGECKKIWNDCTLDERRALAAIASGQTASEGEAALRELRLKELIVGPPDRLFSPIFSAFVLRSGMPDMTGVFVAPDQRQVWVDGRKVEKTLTPLEFTLLLYLARHVGTVCKRDDILRELYGEKMIQANDERLDTILRRLREALGEDARNPRYLVTHRGAGVQLKQGGLQD